MTKDEILSMAREHAICTSADSKEFDHDGLLRFAARVAAKAAQDEREACFDLCRQRYAARVEGGFPREASSARACADDIRARGQ